MLEVIGKSAREEQRSIKYNRELENGKTRKEDESDERMSEGGDEPGPDRRKGRQGMKEEGRER